MDISRRQALAGASAVAAATAAAPALSQAQSGPAWRRNVSGMSWDDPDLIAYRNAVGILRSPEALNDLNWGAIASIHAGVRGESRIIGCPHGNWFFLPWHRAYVLMMERIVRQLSGYAGFAMPYWDWNTNPRVPDAFLEPGTANAPNPLNLTEPDRYMTGTMSLPPRIVGNARIETVLNNPSFRAFASGVPVGDTGEQDSLDLPTWLEVRGTDGALETNPHNPVHVMVGSGIDENGVAIQRPDGGGVMVTGFSPLDPLFWMHHCNIDRLWAIWNRNGNQNTADVRWRGMNFAGMFMRPDGSFDDDPSSDLNDINRMESVLDLGYTYRVGPDLPRLPQPDDEFLLASADTGAFTRRAGGASARSARSAMPQQKQRTTVSSPRNTAAVSIGQPLEIPVTVAAERIAAALKPVTPPPSAVGAPPPLPGGGARTGASPGAFTRRSSSSPVPPAQPPTTGPRVSATIANLQAPGPKANATEYRVFVNKAGLNADTPTTDPSYVTSFMFFGHGTAPPPASFVRRSSNAARSAPRVSAAVQRPQGQSTQGHGAQGHDAHGDAPKSITVDLTATLQRLTVSGAFKPGDPIRLQIVAVGQGDKDQSAIVPARVSVSVR